MKTTSIRRRRKEPGAPVRQTARYGEMETPYFARRKLTPQFRAIMDKLKGGTDSTIIISEDRDRRIE